MIIGWLVALVPWEEKERIGKVVVVVRYNRPERDEGTTDQRCTAAPHYPLLSYS